MNMERPAYSPRYYGSEGREWLYKYMGGQESRFSMLNWWHSVTAPSEPPSHATFAQREMARRGRLASTMLFFFLLVLLLLALPVGIFSANLMIILVATALLMLLVIAAMCNRYGSSTAAGLIIAAGLNIGLFIVILTVPEGLTASSLSLFDLLVFSELFVASLLPSNWVFGAAALNITFIIADLLLQPRPQYMDVLMRSSAAYAILFRPVALHIVVTVVLWLWVRSATRAIKRADRAEEIATLQHNIAQREHAIAQQKRHLDEAVRHIIETHQRIAMGDYGARVPLDRGNVLWPVAGPLNNLLARLQQARRAEEEYQRILPQIQNARHIQYQLHLTAQEVSRLVELIQESRRYQRPIRFGQTNTMLDPLFKELGGHYVLSMPSPFQSHLHSLKGG